MPTDKRQRQRQSQQARQAAIAAARKRQQTRTRAFAGAFLALVLIAGIAVLIIPGDDEETVTSTGPTTTMAAGATKTPVDLPPLAAGASIKGDTPCPPADGSASRTTAFEKAPPMCVDVAKAYTADMQDRKSVV